MRSTLGKIFDKPGRGTLYESSHSDTGIYIPEGMLTYDQVEKLKKYCESVLESKDNNEIQNC